MVAEMKGADIGQSDVEADGVYLIGTFLGFRERRPRTVGDRTFKNADLGVQLAGGTVEVVQYASMDDAESAAGPRKVGDRIALRVVNRTGVKDGTGWQFYAGEGSRDVSAFAGQFSERG